MLISRGRFFVFLFLLLPGPFLGPKLFWFVCSRRTVGRVYFTGGDARLDLPVCIWGDTLVNLLLPLGVWLILFLTPNRFDPLIPWGSKVQLGRRWPCIRVIPMILLLSGSVWAQAQTPKKDTVTLKQATVTARPVRIELGNSEKFHLLCISKYF